MQITFNDNKVIFQIDHLLKQNANLSTAIDKIGDALLTNIQSAFSKESSPWGGAWAALKPITIERRKKKGTCCKKLQDTLALYNSFEKTVDNKSAKVSTGIVYSATHQFGRGRIPARPFMPLDSSGVLLPVDLTKQILDILGDHYALTA